MDLNPDGGQWRHLWCVSDVHGCHPWLMDERARRKFNSEADLLISTGEIIILGKTALNASGFCRLKGSRRPR